jgi:hypothetical protein
MDDDEPIRGEVRLADHRRVSHGLFLRVREGLSHDDEMLRELRAYRLVLPPDAVFTHVTAARLLGWRLPQLPEQVPVFAAVHGVRRPRRAGLICSRLVRTPEPREARGLPVDSPSEILLRAARDLGTLDLVIMIDSALELGHLCATDLEVLLETRRPGVAPLRAAYHLSTPRCESAGETVLRVFHEVLEIPVEPQVVLRDGSGRRIGRADLLVSGTWHVHEYDGAGHRDGAQHRIDLRRERGWAGTPYVRRGFTLDDLLQHPGVVMHELDRALDRPHQVRRLRAWRRMVDNSLYRAGGRARVMNRWKRQMGVVDWPRTA